MANADRPQGFKPYGMVRRITPYEAGSTIYPGDAVKLSSDGQIDSASAGDALLGVALDYATSGQTCRVYDDPAQQFIGQGDEGELDAQTDIGNNCDIVATAGNSTYKASRMEIDSSTVTAAGSAQVQILRLLPEVNNAFGTNAQVVFRINEHQLVDAKSGV
jgi:hypothetical protein